MKHTVEVKQPTRMLMRELMSICRNLDGVVPPVAIMGFGTWVKLSQDFTPVQIHHSIKGLRSVVVETDKGSTSFIPDAYCREGVVVFVWFDAETNHPHLQEFGNIGYISI